MGAANATYGALKRDLPFGAGNLILMEREGNLPFFVAKRYREEAMFSVRDTLRWMLGGRDKKVSVFASEREAYEFVRNAYKESGGVTPELRRTFDFYKAALKDDAGSERTATGNIPSVRKDAVVTLQLRPRSTGLVGKNQSVQATRKASA